MTETLNKTLSDKLRSEKRDAWAIEQVRCYGVRSSFFIDRVLKEFLPVAVHAAVMESVAVEDAALAKIGRFSASGRFIRARKEALK